ncbi:unnamed protein product, partial [Effrenium voratum]
HILGGSDSRCWGVCFWETVLPKIFGDDAAIAPASLRPLLDYLLQPNGSGHSWCGGLQAGHWHLMPARLTTTSMPLQRGWPLKLQMTFLQTGDFIKVTGEQAAAFLKETTFTDGTACWRMVS